MNPRTNSISRRSIVFSITAFLLICGSLFAQDETARSRAAAVLDSLPHAKKIDQVALSPDGSQVAYIVDGKITVTLVGDGSLHAIAAEGNLALRDVAWSADSKRIAFLADLPGDVPAAQVWTSAADGSALAKHAEMKGYVQAPRSSRFYSLRVCRASRARCNP